MRTGTDSGPPCPEARPDPTATVAGGCREQAGGALLGKRRRREARPGEQGGRASLCRGQRRRVSGVPGGAGAGGQVSAPGEAPPAGVTRGQLQGPGGRGQPAAGEEQGIGVGGRNSFQKFVMKERTGIVQNYLHVSMPQGLKDKVDLHVGGTLEQSPREGGKGRTCGDSASPGKTGRTGKDGCASK